MNKKITLSIWAILLLITVFSLFFAYNTSKSLVVTTEQSLSNSNLFMDNVPQCQNDTNTSDRFVCISNLSDITTKEADTLADKLITQAPIRLKEITSTNTGPVSFVYGGSDYLKNLPNGVKNAQKLKNDYIDAVCGLAEMKIYGGSGMDLEKEACIYHFTNEYLQILKNLEKGLIVME